MIKAVASLVLLWMLFAPTGSLAQEPPRNASGNSVSQASVDQPAAERLVPPHSNSSGQQPELIALREQNRLITGYQSSLLDTVYWSLTFVGSLAVVLLGAYWYVNFRLNEQDKQRLIQDAGKLVEDGKKSADLRVAELRVELFQGVQAQLDAHAARLKTEMDLIRSDAKSDLKESDARFTEVNGTVQSATEKINELQRKIEALESQFSELHLTHFEEISEIKGKYIEVLISKASRVFRYHGINDREVRTALKAMKLLLNEKFLSPGSELYMLANDVREISSWIRLGEKAEPGLVLEVLDLLAQVRTGPTH